MTGRSVWTFPDKEKWRGKRSILGGRKYPWSSRAALEETLGITPFTPHSSTVQGGQNRDLIAKREPFPGRLLLRLAVGSPFLPSLLASL